MLPPTFTPRWPVYNGEPRGTGRDAAGPHTSPIYVPRRQFQLLSNSHYFRRKVPGNSLTHPQQTDPDIPFPPPPPEHGTLNVHSTGLYIYSTGAGCCSSVGAIYIYIYIDIYIQSRSTAVVGLAYEEKSRLYVAGVCGAVEQGVCVKYYEGKKN